jgi:hypothetical protein
LRKRTRVKEFASAALGGGAYCCAIVFLMRPLLPLALAALLSTAACGSNQSPPGGPTPAADAGSDTAGPCPAGNLTCDPIAAFPASLEATGLFTSPLRDVRPARGTKYTPSPELYSDGLTKERFLVLPAGAKVDTSKRTAWEFPIGTIAVKTFFDERGGSRHPVETRLIRRVDDRFDPWQFAVYKWNEDGTAASVLRISGNTRNPTPVTVAGRNFTHTIPSRNDCGECHEKNTRAGSNIIGFDELRLNHKLTPDAAAPQLEDLAAQGVLSAAPAKPFAEIKDANPTLERLKRFVFGNCVHCHNGQMNLVDFRPDVFVANVIKKVPESPGLAPPPDHFRVAPGDPEKSVIYLQARGTNLPEGLRPMPQVGVEVRDLPAFADELENMKAWIKSLPPN